MITCRATLDVPRELLRFVPRLLIPERRRRCTPAGSRALTCREQAVMVLRRFRDRTRVEQLGRDHGISGATAYRYVDEGTEVLAARAPDLPEALERAREEGTPFVILDGKLVSTDRLDEQVTSVKGEADRRVVLRQAPPRRGNVQAVIRPDGLPLEPPRPRPGHVHDITAARVHELPALYRAAALGMPTLATAATRAPESASTSPSRAPAEARSSHPATRPGIPCCAASVSRENAGSPCPPSAGPSSSTPPPAPASSPRSSAPPSSSPNSSTNTSGENR